MQYYKLNTIKAMKSKCVCYTANHRKCKNGFYISINDNHYCYNHATKDFNKYIYIIQTSWVTYKKNKHFNIYKNLPSDIQNKIKYYVNEDYYLVKQIKNFVKNKIEILKNLEVNFDNMISYNVFLYNIYIFLNKYRHFIAPEELDNMIIIANNTNHLCIDIIYYIEDTFNYENISINERLYKNKYYYRDFSVLLHEFITSISTLELLNNIF